jgi:hypothetical protein
MPTWSENEMSRVAPLFGGPAQAKWKDRFAVLGGVPRLVFEAHDRDATSIVKNACTNTNLQGIINRIRSQAVITEHSDVIHALIHITSDDDFTEPSLEFASNVAMTIIVQELTREMKQIIGTLLSSYENNRMIAQLTGYFFEKQAIDLLEKGGEFTYRRLANAASKAASASTQHTQAAVAETHLISIPASTLVIVNDVEPDQQQHCLHVPQNPSFPGIDAWIPGIGGFQVTINEKHSAHASVSQRLSRLGGAGNKLYWVLPPRIYDTFTKRYSAEVDEYALLIPSSLVEDMQLLHGTDHR